MIGRALDRLIDNCIIGVGDFANKFFETYWPMTVSEHAKIAAADALADREAEYEVAEPNQWPDELCHDLADQFTSADLSDRIESVREDARRVVAREVRRPFEDTDDFAEPVGEYPDVSPFSPPGSSVSVEGLADTQVSAGPGANVPSPGARPGHSNHVAAVKHIIANGLEWDYENETFDEWLTKTAVEILNALQK